MFLNFKKLYLALAISILMILSLNVVMAVDLNNSNFDNSNCDLANSVINLDYNLDNQIIVSDNLNQIKVSEVDKYSSGLSEYKYDTGSKSKDKYFSDIQKLIDSSSENGTIVLNGTYIANSPIYINKTLTIDGLNNTILKGFDSQNDYLVGSNTQANGKIFVYGKNVILKNLKFSNFSCYTGCLSIIGDNSKIMNCVFYNNTALGFDVSYVCEISGKNCSVINSRFIKNNISNYMIICKFDGSISFMSYGSILYWTGSNGLLKDSYFDNNFTYNDTTISWFGEKGTLINNTIKSNSSHSFDLRGSIKNLVVKFNDSFEAYLFNKTPLNVLITDDNGNNISGLSLVYEIRKSDKYVNTTEGLNNGIATAYFVPNDIGNYSVSISYTSFNRSSGTDINHSVANYSFYAKNPVADKNTFEYIQYLISIAKENSTIILNGTYYGNGVPIIVNKSVKIVGVEDATLDGKGLYRILDIKAKNVVLQNLKVTNGLINSENCIPNYTSFDKKNSNKFSKSGGAIIWFGDNGSLINCTLSNNNVTENNNIFHYYELHSGVNTIGTDASNYYASSNENDYESLRGGAIFWYGNNGKIVNSTFINNYAYQHPYLLMGSAGTGSGGAIYAYGDNLSIVSSLFVNNTACSGGAIFWEGNNAKVQYSIFDYNFAHSPVLPLWDGMGLAIAFNSSKVDFNYNYFVGTGSEWFKKVNWDGINRNYKGGLIFNSSSFTSYVPKYWVVITAKFNDSNINFTNVKANKTYVINVDLNHMVDKKGKIYDFNASKLPDFNIYLKTKYGNKISKNISLVNGSGSFNYTTNIKRFDSIFAYDKNSNLVFDIKVPLFTLAKNVKLNYRDNKLFKIKIIDLNKEAVKGISVTFDLYKNGKFYSSFYKHSNKEGYAYLNLSKLSAANYTVKVIVDDLLDNATKYSIIVKKIRADLIGKDLSTQFKSGKYIRVKLANINKIVRLNDVNSVSNSKNPNPFSNVYLKFDVFTNKKHKSFYAKTNSNGIATLKKNLPIGNYKVIVSSFDKSIVVKAKKYNLNISKIKTAITPISKSVVKNNSYFKVKLFSKNKALANKNILVKSNAKSKFIKTNKDGIAKIKMVAKYHINKISKYSFNFRGNSYYAPCLKTVNVKIIK